MTDGSLYFGEWRALGDIVRGSLADRHGDMGDCHIEDTVRIPAHLFPTPTGNQLSLTSLMRR